MPTEKNPVWAELAQLVPVVSLALPFIVAGKVELARAGGGLLAGALLTIPVTALVLWRRAVLNPILVGTAVWLWLGAVAFTIPIEPLHAVLVELQGFGIFAVVLVTGVLAVAFSPQGYIGCRSDDAPFIRRASLGLLALTVVIVAWSWAFRTNIRLGGGLPFIVLNVARRAMIQRATSLSSNPG